MFAINGNHCKECNIYGQCALKNLSDERLDEISETKRSLTFAKGETIFHLGDDANYFYCIRSGRVQLYRSSPYREQSFDIVESGHWIGHRDVLCGSEYRHNARCLTETTVCKIPRAALENSMQTEPAFATLVARDLATSWSNSEHQSYNLGARKVMERLADFLLSLQNQSQVVDAANQEIDLALTREMLATLMGTTTESVIRTLSDFKARGWIKMTKGKVQFINKEELGRLVAEA